jgi:hypothetical protein
MIYGVTEKPTLRTDGHGGGVSTQWEEVGALQPWVAFLVYNAACRPIFLVICLNSDVILVL